MSWRLCRTLQVGDVQGSLRTVKGVLRKNPNYAGQCAQGHAARDSLTATSGWHTTPDANSMGSKSTATRVSR